jgi:Type IV secretion-system coupling protein DNA-binding domain
VNLTTDLCDLTGSLYEVEQLNNPLQPLPPLLSVNEIEEGRFRDQLLAHQRKSVDAPRTLEVFNATLSTCYRKLIAALPPIAKSTPAEFAKTDTVKSFATLPLIDLMPNVGKTVMSMIRPFFNEEVEEIGLFSRVRRQLDSNFREASGADDRPNSKYISADKYKGTPQEVVSAYLSNTPFEDLFAAPIPFSFSDAHRFEHTHIVGGSGHGKTQLLQHLILNDLQREHPPALIVIDSQGDMLGKIQRLALFSAGQPLSDRLIIIDPEDVEFSPALNMFDTTNARLAGYSKNIREQIESGVNELYNYIFGALAAELTQKQGTAFAYVIRLLLSIEGSTIHTLRELMEDTSPSIEKSPFAKEIQALDLTTQAFFKNQFFKGGEFNQTKQQIARRLYGVLQVPAFDRMFSSKENKLDMFAAMQSRKVVLVNTSKALLKSDASTLFGRYMIALAMKAAYERVATQDRPPAFLFIDEAADYFDENIEVLLSQARKFNVGIVVAHQHMDQLTTELRSSLAANTSIKMAGGVSDRDAHTLAPDMRTTAEFITSMGKHQRSTEFACYVRNYTANAVRLQIPFLSLETAKKMSEDDHKALIARNRKRVAPGPVTAAKPEAPQQATEPKPKPSPSNEPDGGPTDAAGKW